MYYLNFYFSGEDYSYEIDPSNEGCTLLSGALNIIEGFTGDLNVFFTIQDTDGFIVATQEDLTL